MSQQEKHSGVQEAFWRPSSLASRPGQGQCGEDCVGAGWGGVLGQKGVWEMNPTGSWWDLLFRLLQAARPAGPYVRHLRVIYDGKADAELPHSAVLEILRWVPHSTWSCI